MDNGKRSILISPDNVHDALDKLVQVSAHESPNPLHFLLLVDLYLTTIPSAQGRSYVLGEILTSLIADQYAHHRMMLNLSLPDTRINQEQALEFIRLEGQDASAELLSWSWLNYHFVRIDLCISHEQFCRAAHIDKRTLRRYQQHGIKRLSKHLAQREGEARIVQRKRWLYAQLPGAILNPFVGRDNLVKQAAMVLSDVQPAHIVVSGAVGIGKSAFIGQVAKYQIDAGQVDRIIWIDRPKSAEFVRQFLCERLLPEQSRISLREYTLLQRIMIVLDDVESLQNDVLSLNDLLAELSAAQVLLSARSYESLIQCAHIPLGELSQQAIYDLVDMLATEEGSSSLHEKRLISIWEQVGGNPMAAILMFRQWPFSGALPVAVDDLLVNSYLSLDSTLKQAWLAFALLPQKPQSPAQIIQLWSDKINPVHMKYLTQNHLVEVVEDENGSRCCLSRTGCRFIEGRYPIDHEMQHIIVNLVYDLGLQTTQNADLFYDVIEHILLSEWLQINETLRREWLLRFCDEGLRRGRCAEWRLILEPYVHNDVFFSVRLHIDYATCLRRTSEWTQAEKCFENLARSTGRAGLFLDQAHALLEWVILLQHQGKYKKALELMSHIELTLSRQRDDKLLHDLKLVQVQAALDVGDMDQIERIIETLPESPRKLMIRCEVFYLKRDYASLDTLAVKIEPVLQDNPIFLAHMHVVRGQSYQQRLDLRNAYDHLCTALTLLESQGDYFGAARVQSNLGAIMIEKRAFRDARGLLEQAEQTQIHLRDRVGLAATRHNIRLLNRQVVR